MSNLEGGRRDRLQSEVLLALLRGAAESSFKPEEREGPAPSRRRSRVFPTVTTGRQEEGTSQRVILRGKSTLLSGRGG